MTDIPFGMDVGFGIWQILILCIIAVLTILPVIAIIDIFKGKFKGANDRWVWVLVVLFLNPLGTLLYFLIGKDRKIGDAPNQSTNRNNTYESR